MLSCTLDDKLDNKTKGYTFHEPTSDDVDLDFKKKLLNELTVCHHHQPCEPAHSKEAKLSTCIDKLGMTINHVCIYNELYVRI